MLKVTKNAVKIWYFQFFVLPLQCLLKRDITTTSLTTKKYDYEKE